MVRVLKTESDVGKFSNSTMATSRHEDEQRKQATANRRFTVRTTAAKMVVSATPSVKAF